MEFDPFYLPDGIISPATDAIINSLFDRMEENFRERYEKQIELQAKTKLDLNKKYAEIANMDRYTGDYLWITVNALPLIDHQLLVKKAHKAFKKKWISHAIYTIEQRSEISNHFEGYHIHGVAYKGSKSLYECLRELKSTFKTLCNTSNPSCFHVRVVDTETAKEKVSYVLGDKRSEKLAKVENDKLFRAQNNYPDYWLSRVLPNYLLGNTK